MKIIHTSDLHLDSPLSARLSPQNAKIRREELIGTFKKIISKAAEFDRGAVIISGDLFDCANPSPRTVSYVTDLIAAMPNVAFFYLLGNHESELLLNMKINLPQNLYMFKDTFTRYDIGNVSIYGCSKIRKNMFENFMPDKNRINILVLHGVLADRTDDTEKIGLRDIEGLGIDYLALGHYHTYSQTKYSDGIAVYSGTPEGRGFDETGDMGYVLIDTDGGALTHKFVSCAKRKIYEINVDITGAQSELEYEKLIEAKLRHISPESLVRVVLTGSHEADICPDEERLMRSFADGFYCFELYDHSKLKISPSDYLYDKSLKGEFIRLVMGEENLSEEKKQKIIQCAINALTGEEI